MAKVAEVADDNMKNRIFRSVPGAWIVTLACSITVLVSIVMILVCYYTNQLSFLLLCGYLMFALCGVFAAIFSSQQALCSIVLHDDYLLCKIPFSKNIEINYERCNIGLDYHVQNGRKIWWIYLSYGKMPPYKNPQFGNRINSVNCQPGFVRAMYSDILYDTLMEILPKKQKVALASARRNSGFEKQNRPI